jgi:hypothetical protein
MDMIMDDILAKNIRSGATSPDEALQLLRDNKVLVYDKVALGADAKWGDVEDHGVRSGIHHALRAVGAADRSDEFSEQIVRLRNEGLTMESLWEEE